jgi:hypothetical protein
MNINKIILGHLRSDCACFDDIWRNCIYGNSDELDNFDDSDFIVDKDLLSFNYCGVSPKLSRYLCDGCERNFRKISQYISNLEQLALDWNSPFDETIPNSYQIKEILSLAEWKNRNPDFIDNDSWTVKKFDSYFDKDLTPYLEELNQYDVIDFGWYFNQDITILNTLPNLKGIILGHWFNKSLNCLKDCKELKYVHVRYSYNKHIDPTLYDKVYRD